MYVLGGSDVPEESSGLINRGLFDGISIKKLIKVVDRVVKAIPAAVDETWESVKGTSFAVFSSSTLAGYLATFVQVKGQSPGPGIPMLRTLTYFLYPVYGDFPVTINFRLHYNVRRFLGVFGSHGAITFGRDIF